MNTIKLPPRPKGWESELLDWVSACQSAYHIDNSPGHRFGGLGSSLEENRSELVSFVHELLESYATAAIEADRQRSKALGKARSSRSVNQIKEALKDRSKPFTASYSEVENLIRFYEAGQQSQDREEILEMAMCESRRLVLRIGQAYRFVPMEGCKTCEEMKAEHDQAYAIDNASRIEGTGNE